MDVDELFHPCHWATWDWNQVGAKTALPVRGTPEERAVRHCVRTLQEVADWLDSQPASALALRPGSLRVSLADTLTACKTAVRVINEGFEEEL